MTETTPSITKGLPNHAVEAGCSLVRPVFYYVIVPGGRALPGAVPHLDRSQ
jgi:hypothetical protein